MGAYGETMSDSAHTTPRRLHDVTTVVSSMLIPFPMIVSGLVTAVQFTGNPADVDITQDLAYLREILVSGFVALGVIVVVIVALLVATARRARSFSAIRLPLTVFVVQLVLGAVILGLTAISNNAVDTYGG